MKRSPMRRTGWTRRKPVAPPAVAVFGGQTSGARTKASMAKISGHVTAIPKESATRSEAYRRAVAKLPCCLCGISGRSQAAHPNTGKGGGVKTDDTLCFPLCAARPGAPGCHSRFDQGALMAKEERRRFEILAASETQWRLIATGKWPAGLAYPGWVAFLWPECMPSTDPTAAGV